MADKPIECHQCQRTNCISYKEIINDLVHCTEMCADCPILQNKLHGDLPSDRKMTQAETGICCGRCGTTILSVQTGNLVGCPECYSVFEKTLLEKLISHGKVSKRMNMKEKTKKPFLHTGKTPEQTVDLSSASRIVSLNEALKEALKKENYEQAAWLRDQIKELEQPRADL